MLTRFATSAAICVLVSVAPAPLAWADPPADPAVAPAANAAPPPVNAASPGNNGAPPPPDTGAVPSAPPGVVTTPDGWQLTVAGAKETQLPVAPLTTALSSRDYLVGGTFTGSIKGSGSNALNGGVLEAGYQIGCGIELDKVKLIGSIGIGSAGSTLAGLAPTGVSFPISGQIEVDPRPGQVLNVSVDKKKFKGTDSRVTLKDVHIKIDSCVGQSFLRSYAILTSSTSDSDDVVAYYGVTKTV